MTNLSFASHVLVRSVMVAPAEGSQQVRILVIEDEPRILLSLARARSGRLLRSGRARRPGGAPACRDNRLRSRHPRLAVAAPGRPEPAANPGRETARRACGDRLGPRGSRDQAPRLRARRARLPDQAVRVRRAACPRSRASATAG